MSSVEQRTISADAAERCVAAARASATGIGVAVSIAVVDAAGILKAFLHMDGAPVLSVAVSQRKAYTAAALRTSTQDFYDAYRDQPTMLTLIGALPGIAPLGGGVPVREGDTVIGAIGASGATAEQDVAVATSAAAAVSA
jgi:uncharacterized protein GlcG (DUF336 family)